MKKNKVITVTRGIRNKQFSIYAVSISFFAKLIRPHLIWDWLDFGLMLKVSKQNNISKYHFAIDIQIAWLNVWVQCWRKY